MSNGTKILIAILIIAAITVGIVGAVNTTVKKGNKKDGELDEILNYINKTENNSNIEHDNLENEIQENVVEKNNTIETTIVSNQVQNDVIGKEEEDSNKENTEAQNRQKAIQMAKDEWAISVDSYDFQATLKSDGIYEITVISNDSNRTTVAVYTVDVNTGTVTE